MELQLDLQKRLASEVTGVGKSKIKIPIEYAKDVSTALTREEVRKLIKDGLIVIKEKRSNSRGRWRKKHLKRKLKSEGRGRGSRKGSKYARARRKELWVNKVRAQRRFLSYLREKGLITRKVYRIYYKKVKGGAFKSVSSLKQDLINNGYLKGEQ